MYFYFLILFCFVQYKLLISADDLGQVVISPNKSLYQLDKSGASVLLIEKKKLKNPHLLQLVVYFKSMEVFQ